MADYWSWLLTAVGLTCFWLAGRKVWWARQCPECTNAKEKPCP